MKKNKMMRLASGLLVAVLITTSTISGTFAKYTTSGEATDTARVAKFGVEIVATNTAFSNAYKDDDSFGVWAKPETDNTLTVVSSTEAEKVVAPGTAGSLASFAVTGTPEVDVQVTYDATLTLTGWELADSSEYCPIEITVGAETFKVGDNATDLADLKSKVETAIEGKAALYQTNTDLSAVNDDLTVSWAWDFIGNNNDNDTYLGDQAAAGNASKITLTVDMTIDQVD
ncbi:MAG: hypothetical protein IJN27_01345 [Oscillospiraceae bacterium]|nr:hypothetical protein [Oscillospiraceae bacterium]